MVAITIDYQGELHCRAVHVPSGTELMTDAPADNHGRAESFSPTDLLATALGSCMLSVMGIRAQALGIDIAGAKADVVKTMAADPMRRIASLAIRITVPHRPDPTHVAALEQAAMGCPVYRALHPDVQVPVAFSWKHGVLPS